jgi:hypothetical protein
VVVHSHRQNFLGMFLSYNMLVQVLKDLQVITILSPGILRKKTALENAKYQQTGLFKNKMLRQIFRPERGSNRQI